MMPGNYQKGFSLIEVLVSVLIMAIGLLGAAAIQLNALKYTDSSAMRTQASFVAYDMLDRMRANSSVNYSLANLAAAPTAADLNTPRTQDLYDFSTNVTTLAGTTGANSNIVVLNNVITITIYWSDLRAGNAAGTATADTTQSFVLTSRVADDAVTP